MGFFAFLIFLLFSQFSYFPCFSTISVFFPIYVSAFLFWLIALIYSLFFFPAMCLSCLIPTPLCTISVVSLTMPATLSCPLNRQRYILSPYVHLVRNGTSNGEWPCQFHLVRLSSMSVSTSAGPPPHPHLSAYITHTISQQIKALL